MAVRVGYQKSGITPEDHRLYASVSMASTGAMSSASGLVTMGAALSSTGAMTASVGTVRAIVQGTSSSLQGPYPVVVDAAVGLTFTDGHATLPRQDLVVLQVRDNPYDSLGQQDARVTIVVGSAAVSPVAPPVPASSIALWEVRVPAGANAGNGGITWVSALTDRRVLVGQPPIARVQGVSASVASGTVTRLAWSSSIVSRDITPINSSGSAASSAITGLYITRAGYYRLGCSAGWTSNNTGSRGIELYSTTSASGTSGTFLAGYSIAANGAGNAAGTISTDVVPLAVGDIVMAIAYQSSGGSLAIAAINSSPSMTAAWVSL
jgi:hypothetical protein